MANGVIRSLLAEPRVADPPVRVWRDWVLVGLLLVAAITEYAVRQDMPWRPVGAIEVAVLAYALLHRREHPLGMLALSFGTAIAVDLVGLAAGVSGSVGPYSMGFVLVLIYSLFRWGSGRENVLGAAIALLAAVMGLIRDHSSIADSAIGLVILMFPAVLGWTVRFGSASRFVSSIKFD